MQLVWNPLASNLQNDRRPVIHGKVLTDPSSLWVGRRHISLQPLILLPE